MDDIFNSSNFFIRTPMVDNLQNTIQSWMWNGYLGGYILGNSRIGKSSAIRFISDKIPNRFGEIIPTHKFTIPKRDVSTVSSIFKNICFSIGMKLPKRVTADVMANDLIHYFKELACTNKSKQVIIFVDEMQRLKINQIEAFNELHDSLVDLEINLSVIFIGNIKTSEPLLNRIKTSECDHIWGRFFKHYHEFHGIRNQRELRKILCEYDHKLTKLHLPAQYKKGFRVESLSELIWEVYIDNFKSELKIYSWGMQYFTAMMRVLLVDYLPNHDISDSELVYSMIQRSIEVSGLVEELVRVNDD